MGVHYQDAAETVVKEKDTLFSDLLPEKQQNKLKYPEEIDKMHGTELENGIIALTEFLTKVCYL